jgi:glycosyltransferase involved in cell wall biosynthesis
MCVERSINMFLNQQYEGQMELIVFNTDEEHPYVQRDALYYRGVKIVNNGMDYETLLPYTNVGAIRRDALTHARGKYVVTWDDDDIFLPWFISQAIERMKITGMPSFKPEYSFFHAGDRLTPVMNTMEASVVADIELIRKYGYLKETGREGLGWYTKMRDNGEMDEHYKWYIPSYCFNWNDGAAMNAGHKQSGDIDNPNNFENHKAASTDYATRKVELYGYGQMGKIYAPYFEYIMEHISEYDPVLLQIHGIKGCVSLYH